MLARTVPYLTPGRSAALLFSRAGPPGRSGYVGAAAGNRVTSGCSRSVRNRQTKSRVKDRTGPISTANSEPEAECPVASSCPIGAMADWMVR
jgi:hypothetical protein